MTTENQLSLLRLLFSLLISFLETNDLVNNLPRSITDILIHDHGGFSLTEFEIGI